MFITIIKYHTESSDRGVYVIGRTLDEAEVEAHMRDHHSDEWEDGHAYIHWSYTVLMMDKSDDFHIEIP